MMSLKFDPPAGVAGARNAWQSIEEAAN